MPATPKKKTTAKKAAPARPAAVRISTEEDWLVEAEGQPLELPSGRWVRAKFPGLRAFISADYIPNDLLPIVMAGLEEGQLDTGKMTEEIKKNPKRILEMLDLVDHIFAICVTEPKFALLPKVQNEDGTFSYDSGKKEPGRLYVDLASDEDKAFVFYAAVGGTRDLATFRLEQDEELGSLQAGGASRSPAKRAAKSR